MKEANHTGAHTVCIHATSAQWLLVVGNGWETGWEKAAGILTMFYFFIWVLDVKIHWTAHLWLVYFSANVIDKEYSRTQPKRWVIYTLGFFIFLATCVSIAWQLKWKEMTSDGISVILLSWYYLLVGCKIVSYISLWPCGLPECLAHTKWSMCLDKLFAEEGKSPL